MKKKIIQTEVSFKLNLSFIIIPFQTCISFQPWRLSKIQRLKNIKTIQNIIANEIRILREATSLVS